MQLIFSLIILVVGLGIWLIIYAHNLKTRKDIKKSDVETPQDVYSYVAKRQADILKDTNFQAKDDVDYEILKERHMRIEDAYNNCVYGKEKDVIIVKEVIISILNELFPTLDDLYKIFPLNDLDLIPNEWKFEVLLEYLYNEHGRDTMPYILDNYGITQPRYDIEDGKTPSYAMDEEDLNRVIQQEITGPLTFRQALSIVATLCYEQRAFGCIDTLRKQNIDGINLGAYGSIMPNTNEYASAHTATSSVGIYYHGIYIHLRFLNMYSPEEARRIITLLIRYNNPGPLTEKRGYIVNTMEDKSRILAIRPPAAEYWCCFIRKFVLSSHALHNLVCPPKIEDGHPVLDEEGNPVPRYRNTALPEELIALLMTGQVTCGVTGRQGSGKTTLMTACIAFVDARFNIRVLEMAPELYLREIYPERNILSVAETPTVTAAELQDALKKSDAALSIVGEVATDIIAARMIQMGQVASIFTIFSHHANRTSDLVHAITNSIVAASGGSATPATVEPQVIDVIKVDIHLDYDVYGNRYIERITEIIRLDSQPYPARVVGESAEEYKVRLDKEYYTRQTDRQSFTTRDVLRFDTNTFTYYTHSWFSPELTKHIMSRIPREERDYWRKWIREHWSGEYGKSCIYKEA